MNTKTANEQRAAALAKLLVTGQADSARKLAGAPVAPIDPAIPAPAPESVPSPVPTTPVSGPPAKAEAVSVASAPTLPAQTSQAAVDISRMELEDFGAPTKTVSTRLPARLHHTLRVYCVDHGEDQQDLFGEAVLEYLQRQAKRGKAVRVPGQS